MMKDNLWVATNSRIVKVNKKGNEFFVYGTKFGISPQNLTPGPNMVKIKNGQILKGTFDGFHYFTPAELVFKSPPTQILISDFSVNSLTVLTAKEGPLLTSVEDVSETKLSHDENNFSFNFGSDDYRTPHGVRYYTMLENYDKTWREALGDMSTSYFYVNPGNYVFKIMIYNNDGVKTGKDICHSYRSTVVEDLVGLQYVRSNIHSIGICPVPYAKDPDHSHGTAENASKRTGTGEGDREGLR